MKTSALIALLLEHICKYGDTLVMQRAPDSISGETPMVYPWAVEAKVYTGATEYGFPILIIGRADATEMDWLEKYARGLQISRPANEMNFFELEYTSPTTGGICMRDGRTLREAIANAVALSGEAARLRKVEVQV